MDILRSFAILLLAQLAGELLHRAAHVPVPGPAMGMALLAAALLLRRREPDAAMVKTANGLLAWLGLLFVPAGVGLWSQMETLRSAWLPIVVALLGSTVATMAVTALVMQWLLRRRGAKQPEVLP